MNHDLTGIELGRAVAAIRNELVAAAGQAEGQQLRFEVGEIHLEFSVELRHDQRAKAGFRAWVLSADAEAGRATGSVHRLAFTLRPKDARTGGGWDVGNEDVLADTSDFGTAEG